MKKFIFKYQFFLIAILLVLLGFLANSCASSKTQKSTSTSKEDSLVNINTQVKKELETKITDKTVTTTVETEESYSKTKADTLTGERLLKDLQQGKEIVEYDGEIELKTILDSATGFVRTTVVQMPKLIKTTKTRTTSEHKDLSKNEVVTSDSSNHTKSEIKTEDKEVKIDRQTKGMWEVTLGYIFEYWWIWLIIIIILASGYFFYKKYFPIKII